MGGSFAWRSSAPDNSSSFQRVTTRPQDLVLPQAASREFTSQGLNSVAVLCWEVLQPQHTQACSHSLALERHGMVWRWTESFWWNHRMKFFASPLHSGKYEGTEPLWRTVQFNSHPRLTLLLSLEQPCDQPGYRSSGQKPGFGTWNDWDSFSDFCASAFYSFSRSVLLVGLYPLMVVNISLMQHV